MALFDHLFPYTNLHDVNLDWIISIIKSIDPAVIRALQELSPDIIAQVNQKVAEAQAAAIAAQSSASEANTARDEAVKEATEAAADAALANADAVRAEAAKTAVENSLTPVVLTATFADFVTVITQNVWRSGATTYFSAIGTFNSTPTEPDFPVVVTFPSGVGAEFQTMQIIIVSGATTEIESVGVREGRGDLVKQAIKTGAKFLMFGLLK